MNDIAIQSENLKCENIGTPKTKTCPTCNTAKPLVDFCKDNRRSDKRYYQCRECARVAYQNYSSKNPEKILNKQRSYRRNNREQVKKSRDVYLKQNVLKIRQQYIRKYGITYEQMEEMFVSQNGKCGICEKEFVDRRTMHIDHNHSTNKVRKLLCENCNRGLGGFKDNVEILKKAIDYLNITSVSE